MVNVGENLQLLPLIGKITKDGLYVRVLYVEALPFWQRDFGALAAGVQSADIELTDVYLEDGEVGQFRLVVVTDDVVINYFAQPRASRRWVTKNTTWFTLHEYADPRTNPMMEKFHLHEFFQWEDEKIYLRLQSAGGVAASVVAFYGYRFVVEELDRKPTVSTPIPVGGYRKTV